MKDININMYNEDDWNDINKEVDEEEEKMEDDEIPEMNDEE